VIRVIKRYGSRKLYDTEESRYVSLEEIGDWVRQGQEVQVVDNQTADDVTSQALTQVILEEGKRGQPPFSSAFLHDLIRRGEQVVATGVESIQQGVDRLLQASVDRVGPLRRVRDETDELRRRLERLEAVLEEIDAHEPTRGRATSRDKVRGRGPAAVAVARREPVRAAAKTHRKKGA
jgi:polyhydroxyalkanoate synthesis repressor PhaR